MGSSQTGDTLHSECLACIWRHDRRTDGRWALGFPALVGWTVWILGFTSSTIILLFFQLSQAWDVEGVSPALLAASVTSRSALTLASVACCGSYLWVAARMARPRELHLHGLVLLLTVPEILGNQAIDTAGESRGPGAWLPAILKFIPWGVRKVLFVRLVLRKISALGPPESGCRSIHIWGQLLKVIAALMASCGVVHSFWLHVMKLRGVDGEVLKWRFSLKPPPGATAVDLVLLRGSLLVGFLAGLAMQIINCVFICTCRRLIRKTEMKLVARAVHGDMMSKVRRKLQRHFLAICLSLLTTNLTIASAQLDVANFFREDGENALTAFVHMLDVLGDMISILLLSGIGLLLRREDPDAGEISAHIRSLLHSAVLAGRVDVASEGAVFKTPGNFCVVSFPGKFLNDWRSLTWQCEQHLVSSACVFLPRSDPLERFGQHIECPETPGDCWCFSLYGDATPWGCAWFDVWKGNIERAVELGLDLVVTFFPGQSGKGVVPWDSLAASDLWNGIGLGGSQKAEVAFLEKQGYAFIAEDLAATQLRLSGCGGGGA